MKGIPSWSAPWDPLGTLQKVGVNMFWDRWICHHSRTIAQSAVKDGHVSFFNDNFYDLCCEIRATLCFDLWTKSFDRQIKDYRSDLWEWYISLHLVDFCWRRWTYHTWILWARWWFQCFHIFFGIFTPKLGIGWTLVKHIFFRSQPREDFCATFKWVIGHCWWKKSCITVWMHKTLSVDGINYQPQLVQNFFQQNYFVYSRVNIDGIG